MAPKVYKPGPFALLRAVAPLFVAGFASQMTATAARTATPAKKGGAPQAVVPFVRGSHQVKEGPFFDETRQLDASGQNFGPFLLPARGFLRAIWIEISMSGGVLGAGQLHPDWPASCIAQVQLADPGGTTYYGPISGIGNRWTNLYGGYEFENDPFADPEFVGTINAVWRFRIPVEITSHDGYGSLMNQDQQAAYRVTFRQPSLSDCFLVDPTTAPTVRYRGYIEAWEQPPAMDLAKNPVAQFPPGHPTTQYWSEQIYELSGGKNTDRLLRVGNPIRALVMEFRDTAGLRSETVIYPDLRLTWDAQNFLDESLVMRRRENYERYEDASPTGVFAYEWISDVEGHAGNEARNLWLPTNDGTRLDFEGVAGAAGTLHVFTNEVAPAGGSVR